MPSTNDVTVVIDIQRPTPKLGFGKPLILGASSAGSAYKTYLSLDAVVLDFATTTEEYKAAYALFNQGDDSPAEIAILTRKTSATAETISEVLAKAFLCDWYFLIAVTSALADVTVIADAVELDNSRMFLTRSSSKTDLAAIKAGNYTRTAVMYHTTTTNYPEAAWIGRAASAEVGSITWKFKTLTGILPLGLNATELNDIHVLNANTYITKAGDNVTSEGKTVSGEYIDIIHAKDYVKFSIQYGVQKLLNAAPKVSYDDTGIAQIESVVKTVLQRSFNQGIIAKDADGIGLYSTAFKTRQEVDPADRAAREYNDGSFFFELAGAIHKSVIRGVIKL